MPRWAKTKKEERDNRPGLALEKPRLPTPPGRASVGGGEPVRPVPGASEWESLARVRRGVRKLFLAATSRRTEQGQLLRHVQRSRQDRGALRDLDARRCGCDVRAAARKQACGRNCGGQHDVVSTIRTRAAPDAGRAPAGRRRARHRRGRKEQPRTSRSRVPRRRVAARRRSPGAAATRRRHDNAGRLGGARRQTGANDARTTWSSLQGTARRQQLVAGLRACREKRNDCANRIAQPPALDARCTWLVARARIDKTGERATDRVGLASRCYESAVIATS